MYALDKLLSFAEFLGIKDIYNPEQDNISVKKIDIESLLTKIEKKTRLKLKFQNVFPGESGFLTSRGILNEKEIQALYAAYKISKIINRREAIESGCSQLNSGDILLVVGKGHETYQEIQGEKFPFDDMKIVKESFS